MKRFRERFPRSRRCIARPFIRSKYALRRMSIPRWRERCLNLETRHLRLDVRAYVTACLDASSQEDSLMEWAQGIEICDNSFMASLVSQNGTRVVPTTSLVTNGPSNGPIIRHLTGARTYPHGPRLHRMSTSTSFTAVIRQSPKDMPCIRPPFTTCAYSNLHSGSPGAPPQVVSVKGTTRCLPTTRGRRPQRSMRQWRASATSAASHRRDPLTPGRR